MLPPFTMTLIQSYGGDLIVGPRAKLLGKLHRPNASWWVVDRFNAGTMKFEQVFDVERGYPFCIKCGKRLADGYWCEKHVPEWRQALAAEKS